MGADAGGRKLDETRKSLTNTGYYTRVNAKPPHQMDILFRVGMGDYIYAYVRAPAVFGASSSLGETDDFRFPEGLRPCCESYRLNNNRKSVVSGKLEVNHCILNREPVVPPPPGC